MTGSTDSKIEGNEARGNGMDLIDENGACSDNTWQGNAFVTRSQTCITAPKAFAANLTVNSAADDDDGSCDAAPGDCTLREAIDDLNAGLGSSIGFDPATFPPGVLTPIAVASALPALTESGTTVDGSGTGVVIDGPALAGAEDGLAFESGAGTPLSTVTVRAITVRDFPGDGISICGGLRPDCDDPLSRTLVSQVTATGNGSSGIQILGSELESTTVMQSYAGSNTSRGIDIRPDGDLKGLLVSGCAAVLNSSRGFNISAGADTLKVRLLDNTLSRNGSRGVELNCRDRHIRPQVIGNTFSDNGGHGIHLNTTDLLDKPKLSENHSTANDSDGFNLNSGVNVVGAQLTDNVATGNDGQGIYVNAGGDLSKVKLKNNRSVNNTADGIWVEGSRNQLKNNVASDNGTDGIHLDGIDPGTGNKLQGNRAQGNFAAGIRISTGITSASIKRNETRGNGPDLVDENAGCDDNTWQANSYVTRSQACID
jgi:CSLREA domain-containing protein